MFGHSGERPSEQNCAYEYEGPHEQLQDEQGQGDCNAAAALSEVQWVIGEDRRAAAVVGPKGAGKSTLGFEVCFSMAQREGVGGAGSVRPCYFIHCQEDVRNVPRTVRFVKGVCPQRAGANGPLSSRQGDGWGCKGPRSNNGGMDNVCMGNGGAMLCDDNAPWDYRVLERVTLKRFSTIENMVWFFANIHTRADHQLPRAIVIDDLHLYPCSPRRDQTSAIAYLLAVIRDAQAHIERRTREPCVVVLTMEAATHCPLPALARQLGAVLRIKQEGLLGGGGGNNTPQNNSMAVFSMTEDHGILAGLSPPVPCGGSSSAFMRNNGRHTRSCKTGAPRHIRFALGATVLHVVERSDDAECGKADDCVL